MHLPRSRTLQVNEVAKQTRLICSQSWKSPALWNPFNLLDKAQNKMFHVPGPILLGFLAVYVCFFGRTRKLCSFSLLCFPDCFALLTHLPISYHVSRHTCTSLMICSMTSQWKECCHKLGKWHLMSFYDSRGASACRRFSASAHLAQQFLEINHRRWGSDRFLLGFLAYSAWFFNLGKA